MSKAAPVKICVETHHKRKATLWTTIRCLIIGHSDNWNGFEATSKQLRSTFESPSKSIRYPLDPVSKSFRTAFERVPVKLRPETLLLIQLVQEKEFRAHLLAKCGGGGHHLFPKFGPRTQKSRGVRAEKPQKTSKKRPGPIFEPSLRSEGERCKAPIWPTCTAGEYSP